MSIPALVFVGFVVGGLGSESMQALLNCPAYAALQQANCVE
jgi:hypothetical protein